MLDSWTIRPSIKQNVRFHERMYPEIFRGGCSLKILTLSNLKWPPIGHYLLSYAQYLVNRARWLDHYPTMKQNVRLLGKHQPDQIQNGHY